MHVLIVEDEPKVAAFLKKGLQEEQWHVILAGDGEEALAILENTDFSAIVLDIMMPKLDGLSVLRTLRRQGNNTPVLLLTARDAVPDRVAGLQAGADDYLVKPFAFEELLARLQALVRRNRGEFTDLLSVGDLELDTTRHLVQRAGQIIDLTALEFRLLEFLLRNAGRVLSRLSIEEYIWGLNEDPESNIVDVYINHLRNKIDKSFSFPLIHTIRGFGYKIEVQNED